jgi:NADH dehydrogenase
MDVVDAIVSAVSLVPADRIIELAGPESLMRKALIERAGRLLGNKPTVISLPIALGYSLAWVLEKTSSNPPVTRAMLGVLDHDDAINTRAATNLLGLTLTPLDEMLRNVLTD